MRSMVIDEYEMWAGDMRSISDFLQNVFQRNCTVTPLLWVFKGTKGKRRGVHEVEHSSLWWPLINT